MNKIIYLLLLLPVVLAGCRKDPLKQAQKNDNNQAAPSYVGYYIQGAMKNVVATDGGREQPFILLLNADNKAVLVNVNGETNLTYSVQPGRIVLDNNGYFNVENGVIKDWLIAGLNFTRAALHATDKISQLQLKKFGGSIYHVKLGASIYSELEFEAPGALLSYPRADDPQTTYAYTPYANVAGFRHSAQYGTNDFFMLENGKLQVAGYSALNGFSVGVLDRLP